MVILIFETENQYLQIKYQISKFLNPEFNPQITKSLNLI